MWSDFNALTQWRPEHSSAPNPDLLARPQKSRSWRRWLPVPLAAAAAITLAAVWALQLAGALGLVAGLDQPWIGFAASGGLALMMLVAVGVRIKIKDPLPRTTPAIFYLALNTYLCLFAF
jgi:hypothetical protein